MSSRQGLTQSSSNERQLAPVDVGVIVPHGADDLTLASSAWMVPRGR